MPWHADPSIPAPVHLYRLNRADNNPVLPAGDYVVASEDPRERPILRIAITVDMPVRDLVALLTRLADPAAIPQAS